MVDEVDVDVEDAVSCGIGDVFRPRAVTYSGACPQSASFGESVCRTLPTICTYMWSVSRVSRQASYGSSGQGTRSILRQALRPAIVPDRAETKASHAPAGSKMERDER